MENAISHDTWVFEDAVHAKVLPKVDREMKIGFTLLNIFIALAKTGCNTEPASVGARI